MRWVAGFLLVGAALLKAIELMIEPAAALMYPLGRYFLPVQIGVELAVGLLILSGLYWRTLRWLVLVLFTAFAGYSLYLALNGAASCGCFGPLRINPWWTLGLDSAVVIGLLLSTHAPGRKLASETNPDAMRLTSIGRRRAVAVIISIAAVSTVGLFRMADHRTVSAEGITSAGPLHQSLRYKAPNQFETVYAPVLAA